MSDHPGGVTRRTFMKSSALLAASALVHTSAFGALSSAEMAALGPQRLQSGWEHYRGNVGGVWEIWRTNYVGDTVALPWKTVQLPHCFNDRDCVDPDAHYYQGPAWYRTTLKIANPFPNGRTLLHFEGAGQRSEIFVYLDKVAEHVGGYDEFVVDITEAAAKASLVPENKGKVPIAVLCDNSRDVERIPSGLSDFTLYGGLYRNVSLVYVPAIALESVHVETSLQSAASAKVAIRARLYNPVSLRDSLRLSIRVFDPKGSPIFATEKVLPPWVGEREISSCDVIKPDLWSPAMPARYRCEVALTSVHGEVKSSEHFGFRYFEFIDHGPFKLNGERLLIRGTHRHEDYAGFGAAVPEEITRKEMTLIKDLGANFIRLGHYQQSSLVLDLCDELGLLVWEEVPWCRGGIGGENYKQQASNMLRNMIDQHYNHPSVIVWGLGNENDWPGDFPLMDKDAIRSFMKQQNDLAHSLDPSRKTGIRRCDFCRDIVDVYSPSIWAGWYQGRYTDYKSRAEKENQGVNHILHMEWGGDSHARRHSEEADKIFLRDGNTEQVGYDFPVSGANASPAKDGHWSETYACNLFDWHLKEQETMPWLTGAAQWVFKDFPTPERPRNPIPRVNQKGLVERDLTLKEGYYVFQSYWAEKPMVHIYGHSWPVRWGDANENKLVKVYSNCESADLFLNGDFCGTKRRESKDFPAAGLRWAVKFKSGENHLRVVAHKKSAVVTDEVRFQYQTEKWGQPAKLEIKQIAQQGDKITVEARLLDANNLFCVDARNVVKFGIAGEGTLIDNLGTNAASSRVELYNGRAEISLLRNGGSSVVSVSSKGLPVAFVTIA